MVDLWVEGLPGPIGATATHAFWSLDRNGWVSAGALRTGETLGTLDGTTNVAGVEPRLGSETVYNLEVQGDHTFFVSDEKLWVHNSYSCSIPKFTAAMNARAHQIAKGGDIDKIEVLLAKFGGDRSSWRKMKTTTDDGAWIHDYEHHGIGKVGVKWAGDPDPF